MTHTVKTARFAVSPDLFGFHPDFDAKNQPQKHSQLSQIADTDGLGAATPYSF
jgi:hypothetical protein